MAANQDDIAFRSQEYASQVNRDVEPARQRLQNASEGFVQSAAVGMEMMRQGRQDAARNALAQRELDQRQQQIVLERTRDAGALALQQTRQRQAEYELAFTKEIHNTKAIEMQRRILEAQAKTAELGVEEAKRKLSPYSDVVRGGITQQQMNTIIAMSGKRPDFSSGTMADVAPEERDAAKQWLAENSPAAIQRAHDERSIKTAQIAAESRRAGDELDALSAEIETALRIPDKATREKKVTELREALQRYRERLRGIGQNGAAPQPQEQSTAPPTETTGDAFYHDMARNPILKGGR